MVAFRAFFEFVDFDNILGSSLGSHFAFKLLPDPTFTLLTPKRIIILVYRFLWSEQQLKVKFINTV